MTALIANERIVKQSTKEMKFLKVPLIKYDGKYQGNAILVKTLTGVSFEIFNFELSDTIENIKYKI